jgi:hypothetical integral membrane protein (TIGR02206 family)
MTDSQSWPHHFKPYTPTHLCVVLAFAMFVAAIVAMRRCDEVADVQPRRRFLDRSIGWLALSAACFVQAAALWPWRFDYRTALPLHICDIGMFIAPGALLLRWRSLRAMTYFWGLGLSSLSFIYPDLSFGPADFQFWVFWAGHAAIIGPAIYDFSARGFRPHWRDWLFAVKVSIVYLAVIFPIDAIFHLNYGYVGESYKGQRSPVDALGPWPWRVPVMFLAAVLIMVLLVLPWMMGRKRFTQGLAAGADPAGTA